MSQPGTSHNAQAQNINFFLLFVRSHTQHNEHISSLSWFLLTMVSFWFLLLFLSLSLTMCSLIHEKLLLLMLIRILNGKHWKIVLLTLKWAFSNIAYLFSMFALNNWSMSMGIAASMHLSIFVLMVSLLFSNSTISLRNDG